VRYKLFPPDFEGQKGKNNMPKSELDLRAMTPDQVARRLNVTRLTVYRLLKKGEIDAFKVGDQWRIDEDDLKSYIKKQKKRKEWREKQGR
jgi:putative molybdopterin biosynthesis protein